MIGINTGDVWWDVVDELHRDLPTNQVVNALYNHEVTRDGVDYLELVKVENEAQLSFLPTKRLRQVRLKDEDVWTTTSRQTAKIGKVLNKILIYEVENDHLKEMVERVQKIHADNVYELSFVKPEEFPKYFLHENYITAPNSELGKSCMRHEQCQTYFDIYKDNPNLEMVVCMRRGRIAARALVWKNVQLATLADFDNLKSNYTIFGNPTLEKSFSNPNELTMLDRVYSVNPTAKQMITDWGKANCDLVHVTAKNALNFWVKSTNETVRNVALVQKFDKYKYRSYPYIDTLHAYSAKKGWLTNTDLLTSDDGIMYHDIHGTYQRIGNNSPRHDDILYELEHGKPRERQQVPTYTTTATWSESTNPFRTTGGFQ